MVTIIHNELLILYIFLILLSVLHPSVFY